MRNLDFLYKGLELNSPRYFSNDFSKIIFAMLLSVTDQISLSFTFTF